MPRKHVVAEKSAKKNPKNLKRIDIFEKSIQRSKDREESKQNGIRSSWKNKKKAQISAKPQGEKAS